MRHQLLQKKKSFLRSIWVTIIALLIIIWGVVSVARAFSKHRESVLLKQQSNKELADTQEKYDHLSEQIEYLKTDRGVEEELRNRYRVIKSGEELVVIVDNTVPGEPVAQVSFWAKIRLFLGF